jgi:hypothetical protein
VRIETPHLDVTYTPVEKVPYRAYGERPAGAALDVWESL